MDSFPDNIHVDNKDCFDDYRFEHHLSELRKVVYDYILARNEEEYVDLNKFSKNVSGNCDTKNLASCVIEELQDLGWNCKLDFGDTVLYVYSTDKHPSDMYEMIGDI